MGIFNKFKEVNTNQEINGYIINRNTGELLKFPSDTNIYYIPEEVKSISVQALNMISQTAELIDFSNNHNITFLPFGAFSRFTKFKRVVLPDSLKKMDIYFNFNVLNNPLDIVLPHNLEQFAQNQFTPTTTSLKLDDTITNLKNGIVSHNCILKELYVSGKIKSLNKYCINQVRYLEKLYLNEGIIVMDANAIRGCNNLSEIHIPSSLLFFKLGADDYRPIKELPFSSENYIPSKEQMENEANRIIKLYKNINGEEILFEVNRSQFVSLRETPNAIEFKGLNETFIISKDELNNCKHFIVDIFSKKFIKQDEIKNNNTQNGSFNYNNDDDIKNPGIRISGGRTTPIGQKEKIEKILKWKIGTIKKVKDQSTGIFVDVIKSQTELSNEMVGLLEMLEDEEELNISTSMQLELAKDIKALYARLISTAPVEPVAIENYKLQLMEKYGIDSEEELDKRLFGQQESIDRQNQDMDEVESFGRIHR